MATLLHPKLNFNAGLLNKQIHRYQQSMPIMISKNLLSMGVNFVIPLKILKFSGYVNVNEFLYTRVTFWINTILHHIYVMMNLPRCKCSCMNHKPLSILKTQIRSSTHTLLVSNFIKSSLKVCECYLFLKRKRKMTPIQLVSWEIVGHQVGAP